MFYLSYLAAENRPFGLSRKGEISRCAFEVQ